MTATQAWRALLRAGVTARACVELPADDPLRREAEHTLEVARWRFAMVLRRINQEGQ